MTQKDKTFWNKMAKCCSNRLDNQNTNDSTMHALNTDTDVLEIGTGKGSVARSIADEVKSVLATDLSGAIVEQAKAIAHPENVVFAVQDANNLELEDATFDAVLICNLLHILNRPEDALKEIHRVLKPNGILIAPTPMWKELSLMGRIEKSIMKRDFPIHSKWNSDEFCEFLQANQFNVTKSEIIKLGFKICYVECTKVLLNNQKN